MVPPNTHDMEGSFSKLHPDYSIAVPRFAARVRKLIVQNQLIIAPNLQATLYLKYPPCLAVGSLSNLNENSSGVQ